MGNRDGSLPDRRRRRRGRARSLDLGHVCPPAGTDPRRLARVTSACDHYHLYREDFALMTRARACGTTASPSPGRASSPRAPAPRTQTGLDFYERLVDSMQEHGIEPFATLYHWDLPQPLQDAGGWTNRATADRFVEYADVVTRRLGKKIRNWMTHNEPWVVAFVGNLYGSHAPGLTDLPHGALRGSHASCSRTARPSPSSAPTSAPGRGWGSSTTSNGWSRRPGATRTGRAAARHDGAFNRWFLDPVFKGTLPRRHAGVVREERPGRAAGRPRDHPRPDRLPRASTTTRGGSSPMTRRAISCTCAAFPTRSCRTPTTRSGRSAPRDCTGCSCG